VNGTTYVIVAYVIGLGLLLGYALTLWIAARKTCKREEGSES
jgi:hypothetical protein